MMCIIHFYFPFLFLGPPLTSADPFFFLNELLSYLHGGMNSLESRILNKVIQTQRDKSF